MTAATGAATPAGALAGGFGTTPVRKPPVCCSTPRTCAVVLIGTPCLRCGAASRRRRGCSRRRVPPRVLFAEAAGNCAVRGWGAAGAWAWAWAWAVAGSGAVRLSSRTPQVENRAGPTRDGATNDGHALGGQLGAGLGLKGGSQPAGLGQSSFQGGELVGVQALVE